MKFLNLHTIMCSTFLILFCILLGFALLMERRQMVERHQKMVLEYAREERQYFRGVFNPPELVQVSDALMRAESNLALTHEGRTIAIINHLERINRILDNETSLFNLLQLHFRPWITADEIEAVLVQSTDQMMPSNEYAEAWMRYTSCLQKLEILRNCF